MKHRGFVYQTESGEWVLATEPDLKSCCLGKKGQIYLDGDFSRCQSHQAYTLKGTLNGNHLEGAQLIEKGSFPLSPLLFLLFFIPIIKKLIKR